MTVGNGIIYLLVQQGWVAESNIRQMHVASFDPQTGVATVMTPTVMGIVGSGIAHTAFSYGEGFLWLYGYDQAVGGPSVVRISPANGQPVATVTSVPEIGGLFPSVVADPDGAWFAGGPGGSPDLVELPTGSSATRTAYAGPPRSAVIWLAAVHGAVWAEIADYGNGPKPSFRTRLDSFDETAPIAAASVPTRPPISSPLVATSNGHLWTLSFPETMSGAVTRSWTRSSRQRCGQWGRPPPGVAISVWTDGEPVLHRHRRPECLLADPRRPARREPSLPRAHLTPSGAHQCIE